MTDDATTPERRVSIALSGGGHRASLWGLGAVLGVVVAREAQGAHADTATSPVRVSSIASVSGGSITNGVIAQQFPDLNDVSSATFIQRTRRAARSFESDGLIFFAKATNVFVGTLLVVIALAVATLVAASWLISSAGRDWPGWVVAVAFLAPIGVAGWFVARRLRKQGPPSGRRSVSTRLVLGSLAASALLGGASVAGVLLGRAVHGDAAWVSAATAGIVAGTVTWVAIRLAARRGTVVEDALARVHFHDAGGTPTRLADLADRTVHHVLCASELQSGEHFYMSPALLHSYRLGEAPSPESMTLARAVQASAALPGAFPPQETKLQDLPPLERPWPIDGAGPGTDASRVVLADGGVYDNMGDEWGLGFSRRTERSKILADVEQPPTLLVVANAGKGLGWKTFGATNSVTREVRALVRDQQIQYDATTAQRRRALVAHFRTLEADAPGSGGIIVHIETSPYRITDTFRRSPDAGRRARARAWEEWLDGRGRSREDWQRLVDTNGAVPTVLHGLGRETSLDLLEHSLVLTLVELSVIHDIGVVGAPTREELERDFFETDSAQT